MASERPQNFDSPTHFSEVAHAYTLSLEARLRKQEEQIARLREAIQSALWLLPEGRGERIEVTLRAALSPDVTYPT